MKKILLSLMTAVCLSAAAQTPQPPEIAARSYLLLDVTADQILAQKDIDTPVEPASLTKLMTAYLVFDALRSKKLDLKQTLPVSERAWKMPGSRMFIDPKMKVPVEDLLKGMIVQSGNDATMALAEGVGGSKERFVQLMNDQAKALGMKATGYKNPEGLTEAGHTTTARDLSILATRLMRDFPDYVAYYAIKNYRYEGTPAANDSNRNLLLFRDPTVDGLKTGHTDAAGYCLIATARREVPGLGKAGAVAGSPAALGSRRLLSIVLGAASENARANESQKLLNWGYTAFEAVKLFDANQAVVTPAVWKGKVPTVALGQTRAIVVAVPTGMGAKLSTQVVRPEPLVAPFNKGQEVGLLKISSAGQAVSEVPLQVLEAVEQAGVLGRAWDALRLWIK
ncbi:D-alanyl-D-alanine carboxypeptidase family protein [Rhodoferax sp.]|uniref:D-alanyl-D-alanine carboxypeptidase family protein n=1 Tax=Rhodoferax sp. TaxID=50421 RepID=UPI00263879ED|nr:D-alanyl-D-alanine carboxypeptidase family protein [Rhodoferax sp.]MDD2920351.1 D-alanyl-D-alanine carboxypeptidase [Rhodoferax sp.]